MLVAAMKKVHICRVETSTTSPNDGPSFMCLDYIEGYIKMGGLNEALYAQCRIITLASYEKDNSVSRDRELKDYIVNVYLDEKEKGEMIGMRAPERNVAHLTRHVCLPVTHKGCIHCKVANDGWLDFYGLELSWCQCLYV